MKKRIECSISGRVQMVMYRDFATRKAKALGLVGSVRNMPDGSVFVVAEGEEEKLREFVRKLERGSVLAHVEHVAVVWTAASGEFDTFTLLYTS